MAHFGMKISYSKKYLEIQKNRAPGEADKVKNDFLAYRDS